MKIIIINSGKHGAHQCLVDDEDYTFLLGYKWWLSKNRYTYYAVCRVGKSKMKMHRLILNCHDKDVVDHKDGNGLNNQRINLRICTKQENNFNTKKKRKNPSSKYKGLHFSGGKYNVELRKDYKKIYIGRFDNEIAAALAYNEAATKHFGEFAFLNKIDESLTQGIKIERSKRAKPMLQMTSSGEIIKTWDSVNEASQSLSISQGNLSSAARGERNTCGGYKWKYL